MKREVSPLKKHIEESPKIRALKERRKQARKRWTFFFGFLFVALVVGFVFTARHPKLQIRQAVVEGNQVVDTKDVVSLIDTDLSGMYAYVIPRRNSFLYPKHRIIADLRHAFPRFDSVEVYRTNLDSLLVKVSEVRGHALWCGDGTTTISNDVPCWFTDGGGRIVSLAPQYSGNVYLRFFGGFIDPTDESVLGKSFMNPEAFQRLIAFGEDVSKLGFNVRAIVIGEGEEDSVVIDVGRGKSASIRLMKDANYGLLASNLSAAVGKPELAARLKADLSRLEYFDLRYSNKVYYKFSDGQ